MRLRTKTVKTIAIICMGLSAFMNISAQPLQTLKGHIFDIETRESLVRATISIQDTDPLVGGSTNTYGEFSIPNVPLGRRNIQITYTGYELMVVSELMITSGKEAVIEIGLKESISELSEVVIQASTQKEKPLNSMANVSARKLTVEEAGKFAGGVNDPARLVSAYAGVSVGNIQNNSIIVRGNASQGVSWRLEGVEIPTPHHFAGANVTGGGFITLLSSQMMANSDFFTGAFPAEYGNALAAVFDMKLRNGNADKFEHTAQIGVMGVDISSEGPLSKNHKSSYLFNYRYSTFELLSDLKLLPSDQSFKYQDLSFKFNFPTRKAGTFSLWAIGGIDHSADLAENDSTKWELDYHRATLAWDMYLGSIGLSHKIITGTNSYLHTTAAFSGSLNKINAHLKNS